LRRDAGEQVVVEGADYHVEADPEPMLALIAEIARRRRELAQRAKQI